MVTELRKNLGFIAFLIAAGLLYQAVVVKKVAK